MYRCKLMLMLSACLLMGLAGVVRADDDVQAELKRLQTRVAELEAKESGNWLNERRAEEVKSLIHEVLSDADTRASLLQDGAVAGHNGKSFFLASADNAYLMEIWGQIQFRYVFNFENSDDDNDDMEDEGFNVRRAKIGFTGHVTAGRKWDYTVVLATNRASGNTFTEDVIVGTALTDMFRVDFGHFKLPFLREELVSSKRQLAVDRASVTEMFTGNRADQIQLSYHGDMFKVAVAISDGFPGGGFTTIGGDGVEFAITARGDVKLMGEWDQAKDFTAWDGEPNAIFLGGAVHYQMGDAKNGGVADYFSWTVDGSLEMNHIGVFASLTGGHIDPDAAAAADRDMYGFLIQGSYNINDQIEPFVRFEWIDADTAAVSDDEAMLLTLGANYYFKKHHAKFTLDVVILLDGDTFAAAGFGNPFGAAQASDGLGFSAGDPHAEDNILIRTQFQLLF